MDNEFNDMVRATGAILLKYTHPSNPSIWRRINRSASQYPLACLPTDLSNARDIASWQCNKLESFFPTIQNSRLTNQCQFGESLKAWYINKLQIYHHAAFWYQAKISKCSLGSYSKTATTQREQAFRLSSKCWRCKYIKELVV